MDLPSVLKALERLAPLKLAQKWDNVGLLVKPANSVPITRVLLTNDFTQNVMQEALELDVNMVITYHPLIFRGFKSVGDDWKSRIVASCLRNDIAVYSPHTSWDSVRGGSSDWLLKAFEGIGYDTSTPLVLDDNKKYYIVACIHQNLQEEAFQALKKLGILVTLVENDAAKFGLKCKYDDLGVVLDCTRRMKSEGDGVSQCGVFQADSREEEKTKTGGGRWCTLNRPATLNEVIPLVKSHLKLEKIRVAQAVGLDPSSTSIKTVGVCCGSGASLINSGGTKLDLYLTGEMSHHEVLDAVHEGTTIILCDHSNTERGFLVEAKAMLERETNGVEFVVSKTDADPLSVV